MEIQAMHGGIPRFRSTCGGRPALPRSRPPTGGRLAFTLIELLVVVSIMALLMTILVPSLKRAKGTARETVCKTNLRTIYITQTLYLQDHHRFQPLNSDLNDGKWQYNYLIYDGSDWDSNFGPLVVGSKPLLPEIKILYCPFQMDPFHSLNTSDNPWPTEDEMDSHASYGRRHLLTGLALSDVRKSIAVFSDVIHLPKVVLSGHKRGVNVVYIDGHATWVSNPGILTENELGEPFDELDNPIMDAIWKTLDRLQ